MVQAMIVRIAKFIWRLAYSLKTVSDFIVIVS